MTVHFFEPIGQSGIYQHTCQVAAILAARGETVVIHTARNAEPVAPSGVPVCECSWWPRHGRPGPVAATAMVTKILTSTMPHLHRSVRAGDVLHFQAAVASSGLAALTLAIGRTRRSRRVVFSPHNAFSRQGRVDALWFRLALRLPNAIVLHARPDVERLREQGRTAYYAPLVQPVAEPSVADVHCWRRRWHARPGDDVVLLAGHLRPDKRLDLLIESATRWPANRLLAVVGRDKGAWKDAAALAERRQIQVRAHLEFVPLEEFCAAIAAADLVVAPYERASQSGVLAIASQLGVPTVASELGGLPELACSTFTAGDVAGLTAAIDARLAVPRDRTHRATFDTDATVRALLTAYAPARFDNPA